MITVLSCLIICIVAYFNLRDKKPNLPAGRVTRQPGPIYGIIRYVGSAWRGK